MLNKLILVGLIILSLTYIYCEKTQSSWALFESKERGLILINKTTGETFRSVRFTYLRRSPLGWEKIYRYPEESEALHAQFPEETTSKEEANVMPDPISKEDSVRDQKRTER